jgi:hypothetical protein
MTSQLENIMKHFGTFYMTQESDEFMEDTIKEIKAEIEASK